MCCFFTVLLFFGPRLAILIWWIAQPVRWYGQTEISAFQSWIWPLLGFIFLPWTTLMYVAVYPGGLVFFDWILLALALIVDIGTYAGGGRETRERGYV